jgi:hypothetical protein
MVVGRIVMVIPLPNQTNEKVSIDSFVMMKRNEVQIIKTEDGRDQKDAGDEK